MENKNQNTVVDQVDINLDEILGTPGAESVMLPEDGKTKVEKPNIFTNKTVDLSFLNTETDDDSDDQDDSDDDADDAKPDHTQNKDSNKDINKDDIDIDSIVNDFEDEDDKPQAASNNLLNGIKKLVEKGVIVPFEDAEDIEKYTEEEIQELIEANFEHKQAEMQNDLAKNFFDSLPRELQYATEYVANGGTDLKGFFRALSENEEVKELSLDSEDDQKKIIRSYLTATKFGDADEIEEEIQEWADREMLKDKAEKFKPKLDKMQEQVIAQKLAKQDELRKKKEVASRKYMQNVHAAISKGELGGVKLDKNTQALLYNGLVQPSYPSISGKQTNLLGHLLEKYQYVEPKHDLIAEVLWHLADPDGFKSKIRDVGTKEEREKVIRTLKTEQATKKTGSPVIVEEENKKTRIPRAQKNIFARN